LIKFFGKNCYRYFRYISALPEAQSFGTMFERSETEDGYIQNDFSSGLTLHLTRKFFLNGVYNNTIVKNESEEVLIQFFIIPVVL
jgi:hypothetical protein